MDNIKLILGIVGLGFALAGLIDQIKNRKESSRFWILSTMCWAGAYFLFAIQAH